MLKTVRSQIVGKSQVDLVVKDGHHYGKIDGIVVCDGENNERVWLETLDEVHRRNPKFFGYDGAKSRFLYFFPNGFEDRNFLANERGYKIEAKESLESELTPEVASTGAGYGEIVLRAFRDTNLLFSVEKARMQETLRGPNADSFIQAAAQFTLEPDQASLMRMEKALKPHNIAKWIVVTYLPFLWRPQVHMFLKPEVTRQFAERVGHSYSTTYQPALNIKIYTSLCDLAGKTASAISDLKPKDNIDVQSFIWTAMDYVEADKLLS